MLNPTNICLYIFNSSSQQAFAALIILSLKSSALPVHRQKIFLCSSTRANFSDKILQAVNVRHM